MKVLCLGHASYNISIPIEKFPIENTKYRLTETLGSSGGTSCTAAALLGMWGVETYYQGVLGDDYYGHKIIDELKEVDVNTDFVEISKKEETPLSFILVNKKNISRTLFDCGQKNEKPKNLNYGFEPDIIFIDGHYLEFTKKVLNKFPKAIKVIDAGRISDDLLELCEMCDYIVCSRGFAETVSKTRINFRDRETLKDVFKKLEKKYKGKVVVTLEEKGCMFKVGDKVKLMTGLKVEEVDTTAAGDIFHGAFVYALTKKLPIDKCCRISNIAGGLSVKVMGTKPSIPKLNDVYEIYKKNN